MERSREQIIADLRSNTIEKCADRLKKAKKDRLNREDEHGITSITKSKYLFIVFCMCLICISPALAEASNVSNIITDKPVINLIGGGKPLPVVYLGEYADVSKVVGWTGQLGYWNAGYQTTSKPDLVVDASTFQHRFYIDPSKFKVGIWYKWDGDYEDSSNNEAFEVKSGIRPSAIPTTVNNNGSYITPIPTTIPNHPENVHIMIARGDQVEYKYWSSDSRKYGSVWLFGKNYALLGNSMESPTEGDNLFKFLFLEATTQSLPVGWYTGYLQFYSKRPDVFYNKDENTLDTPYDDAIIKDINLAGLTPDRTKAEFDKLESNVAYTDDKLVNITVDMKDPLIQFTDYYEEADTIVIQGKSTLCEGTNVSFIVDPEKYTTGYSTRTHTVTVPLTGEINGYREFTVRLPVDWSQMAIGRHSVVAKVDKLKIHLTQTKEFDVTSINVNPTPTPEQVKIIVEDGGWHRIDGAQATNQTATNATPIATPTPQVIYVNATPQIIYVTVTPSVTPTTAAPIATETTEESPLPPEITIGALAIIGIIVVWRK